MLSALLAAGSFIALGFNAPYIIAEMTDGEISEEVSYHGGRANAPHQAGSIGKYVCTLAALRMQNAGLIKLDAPVSELLPEFRGPQAQTVTLRRLLENRSGLEDKLIPALQADPDLPNKTIPFETAINEIAVGEANQAPGVAFDYANGNWVLVGAILERAAGTSLADALQDWVMSPAGMDSSYIIDRELSGPDPVIALEDSLPLPSFMACAGGLAATATDLLKLSQYPFFSDDFDFDDRTALQMVTSPEQDYTLGGRFKLVTEAETGTSRRISWQSGNNGPWYAFVAYDPATGNGLAMLAPDASNGEILLDKRAAWLESKGLAGE
jgi:CubicO group peptidase (beta-lactamase class C family)